ncbi:MAG TPA: helix-turn-helix transcriptional regulator [Solirubrobacterales bacterium]|nr:helix-turn-helix transcriptional regulator [Solirubrobacterales bacterium]
MNVAERFGENLARLRREAGLTQEELAARAAVHRTQVGLLETGQRQPRIDTLVKLAGALSVDSCALLEGIVWVPPATDTGRFEVSDKS